MIFRKLFKRRRSGTIARERLQILLVTDRIGCNPNTTESIKNDIAVCDAMIQRTAKVDKEILEAGKNLKIIARHGAGYDNLD